MTDQLLKLRPLALLLVLIGFALSIFTTLIGLIAGGFSYGFLNALSSYGSSLTRSIFPVVLAVLLVLAATIKPDVPNLRLFSLGSLILTAISVGLGVLFSLIGIFGASIGLGALSFFSSLAAVTISLVSAVVMLRVFTALPKPAPSQAYGQAGQLPQSGPGGVPGPGQQYVGGQAGGRIGVGQWGQQGSDQGQQGQQGQQQPVWQPDQAAGASWGTAQDAATGGAGTWGGQGQTGWQPQQGQPSQPSAGYPQTQPSAGYPQHQPSAGYPQHQPSAGYPQNQPSAGYPQNQPSAGYPQNQPSAGYPQHQPSAGYPAAEPPADYPQQSAAYPSQPPPVNPPVSQASAWDDDQDDRTRLTPRVEAQPPSGEQPVQPVQPPQWGQPPQS